MTISTALVSLQHPKDVSLDDIEQELREIWRNYSSEEGVVATRATTFTFVVYEPDETQNLLAALGYYTGPIDGIAGARTTGAIKLAQKNHGLEPTGKATAALLAALKQELSDRKMEGTALSGHGGALDGAGVADAIATTNPCRIIALCPTAEDDDGVTAQVSAYCPVNQGGSSRLLCCEYITLRGTAIALERIGGIITELMVSDLPKYLWWKAEPQCDYGLFKRLSQCSNQVIFDSSVFREPEGEFLNLDKLLAQNLTVADLNWSRLNPWQELAAEAFDPPERRSQIWEVDRITIDYEQGNTAQAMLYLGWLASRLQWTPTRYVHEGGDYDCRRITFTTQDHKTIEAELAGIPIADTGEIPGDLISLRLTSTNLDADCCTVLCSETTGCMRMEAGGGAQSCRIQQVTPLFDQKTEHLLGQQLQRGGLQDVLYQDSLRLTAAMIGVKTAAAAPSP